MLTFLGSKRRQRKYIKPLIPLNYKNYIDCFGGSGIITSIFPPNKRNIYNDIDIFLVKLIKNLYRNTKNINKKIEKVRRKIKKLSMKDIKKYILNIKNDEIRYLLIIKLRWRPTGGKIIFHNDSY